MTYVLNKMLSSFLITVLLIFSTTHDINANESVKIPIVSASVSSEVAGFPTTSAFDGDTSTLWKAETSFPQWILLDLGSPQTINKLVLSVPQSNKGRAIHIIEAGNDQNNLTNVITLDQIFYQSQTVTVPFLSPIPNVRFIKITTTEKPNSTGWREIEVYSGNASVSPIRYFGYLSQEGKFQDRITDQYFAELDSLNNTNIAWVYGDPYNLSKFKEHNIKALIRSPVDDIFFLNGGLNPNWEAEWLSFKQQISGYEDVIYGFEIDEPLLVNNISQEAFVTATRAMRQSYPDKAVLVIEFRGAVDQIPNGYYQYVTDVAFDYYFTRSENPGVYSDWGTYLNYFEVYKQAIGNRRFWVIPDGQGPLGTQTKWPAAFEKYLSLVMTYPQGVGLLSFQYNAGPTYEGPNLGRVLNPGPLYMEEFRNRHIEVGQIITKRGNITKLGDIDMDNDVDIDDFNRLVADFGAQNSPADFNNNGVVDIFDYNTLVANFGI